MGSRPTRTAGSQLLTPDATEPSTAWNAQGKRERRSRRRGYRCGSDDAVAAAFNRIRLDPRHRAVVVLSRRIVDHREFGPWQMADKSAATGAEVMDKVVPLLADASPAVRGTFEGFMHVKRAA